MPSWVYSQYRLAKGDLRSIDKCRHSTEETQKRGVLMAHFLLTDA